MKLKIFDILFNRNQFVYAGIYLLLIPIFALVYSLLPSYQFYHSTAKYEYSVLNPQADKILAEMNRQIQINYKNNLEKKQKVDDLRLFNINNISLFSLKYEDGRFSFKIVYDEFFKMNEEDTSYAYSRGSYKLSFPLKSTMIITEPKKQQQVFLMEIQNENAINKVDTLFFNNRINKIFSYKKIQLPFLVINKDLDDRLNEFASTVSGFPTSFSDNYWRMFYLSSVTLTTLGFGDIVPVTNTTRILISIEAIVGVVLIGLFLNALSKRKK